MTWIKRAVVYVLTLEARLALWRHRPKIIAVTGSLGKTSTKDAIYEMLSGEFHVRKSEKSLNSDIGVPLAVLGLESAWRSPLRWAANIARGLLVVSLRSPYPAWIILEVGADRPGDIRHIARWLKPDIVVITGVPEIPAHVEYFSSPEELVLEKRSLAEYLAPGGTLIVNGDDERMKTLCRELGVRMLTYGLGTKNDWSASHLMTSYDKKRPIGIRFKINHRGGTMPVSLSGVLGRARAYAALAARAIADIVGIDRESATRALAGWKPAPGRMRVVAGVHGSTIIDDTYNSSPVAAFAALDALKEVRAPRKIAIVGDMLELGKYSAEAHGRVGKHAAACADVVITVGFRSRATAEAALESGMSKESVRVYEQGESRRAGRDLRNELRDGDVILAKGSQAMRMERAVEELMADPEEAVDLLVRQEPEWFLR